MSWPAVMSVVIFGAIFSGLYIQYILKSKGLPVVWLHGAKSLSNYSNLLTVIKEESEPRTKAKFMMVFILHMACIMSMFVMCVLDIAGVMNF